MAVRRCVVVSGRVQGVFFRDSLQREAAAAGVSGWVRNCENGDVEACFEGEPDAVGRLVDWSRQGPPRAVVTGVRVRDEPPTGDRAFRVRP
jgi:acylphosphatase